MSSLFGTLTVALSGLQAAQAGLEVTTNNVANANTPGYSRQRVILAEGDPVIEGPLSFGSGVVVRGVESLRDSILELRLNQETQQQGQLDATVTAMQQAQVMFSGTGNDLGTQITNFFNSMQQLATNPTDLSQRRVVLSTANNLTAAFHTMAANLQSQRGNLDVSVSQTVSQINVLTGQIARLNSQISGLENLHQDADTFVDQRSAIIQQLSSLVDVSEVQSDTGLTLTTSKGTALVAGGQSFSLQAQLDPSGVEHVFAQGADITTSLAAGKIAGLIDVRDQKIPSLLDDLDTLATSLATAVNAAHQQGFDLSGGQGGIFFALPASGSGAAAGLSVAITDPTKLAASSDGSPGSNGNLTRLIDLQNQGIAGGQTPTDFYAGMVYRVGEDLANATAEQGACQQILQQLSDQRATVSGVSMDEEASNLVLYQRSYEAAARIISTISDLTETAVQLGKY